MSAKQIDILYKQDFTKNISR